MAELLTPDLCILGAGAGGLALARQARALGASVVIAEAGPIGGTGLRTGAVPAEALVAAAARAQAMRTAPAFGIAAEEPKMHFGRLNDHIKQVIAAIAPDNAEEQLAAEGITVVRAEGQFTDPRTVMAGDTTIKARRFVIATGAAPYVPDIPGLAEVPYFTTQTIFDATRKLTHLLVIGAGATGVEMAQAYRRLGAMVTVVENRVALAEVDAELREIALRQLREEGVDLREGAEVAEVQARSLGIGVTVRQKDEDQALDISHILVAAGRAPRLDGMGLEKARIRRVGAHGPLALRANLRTSNRRVFALGDAAGGRATTTAAVEQAGTVLRAALAGLPARLRQHVVPRVIHTDPEIAEVGLTEPLARAERKTNYLVLRAGYGENDRARARRLVPGLCKVITDRRGVVLGAGIVGAQAGETIALFSLAVANGMTIAEMAAAALPYPSLAGVVEVLAREARIAGKPDWRRSGLQRMMAFNRLFG